ncbi:peptidoglycan-binding domain-containing protein [Ancylobacter lacus]|uniref:peptidoglycan-binding domain-containing protein n=1 Tax=Ancylobacter lacus TaxID=2579970 RepID=UPI001BCFD751|nr:peptidoglycan-binding domain-containing protein [Ancylobacter lacus]MBS7539351.1 peptidoglycan-binding protein [Ancylobacter lacus]
MPRALVAELSEDDIEFQRSRGGSLGGLLPTRRSDAFVTALLLAGAGAVLFNALAMQTGTRPGTLPRTVAAPPAAAPAPLPAAAPAAARSPLPEDPAEPAAPAAPAATPLPPSKPPAPPKPKPAAAAPAAGAPQSPAAPAPAGPTAALTSGAAAMRPPANVAVTPRVMEVQKALAKLGYGPLRIDGQTGAMTDEAIKRFERDRRLPITGQVSDRLVRELNAVGGFSIQ